MGQISIVIVVCVLAHFLGVIIVLILRKESAKQRFAKSFR